MNLMRLHLLGVLLALISFATSMPAPFKPHGPHSDFRRSSLIQIDDDEEREILPDPLEMSDEDEDDPAEDGEGA